MKQILVFLFFGLISCKRDVGLESNNNICLTIAESKEKDVFKNNYLIKVGGNLNEVEIFEAWSENVWFYENGVITKNDKQLNFNISLKFKTKDDNFLSYDAILLNQSEYFDSAAFVSNIYRFRFKESAIEKDSLRLLLKIKKDTVPILFIKQNKIQ